MQKTFFPNEFNNWLMIGSMTFDYSVQALDWLFSFIFNFYIDLFEREKFNSIDKRLSAYYLLNLRILNWF